MSHPTKLTSPAKLNYTLSVTGKDEEGYHLLNSLVGFIDLEDEITIAPSDTFETVFEGDFTSSVRSDENSITKLFGLLHKKPKSKITLTKNIPAGAGLGGGSGNAAAVLKHYAPDLGLSKDQMLDLAEKVGADVPCFLKEGPHYMGERGGKTLAAATLPEFYVVLMVPNLPTFTVDVYKNFMFSKPVVPQMPTQWASLEEFIQYLRLYSNQLMGVAMMLNPAIRGCLTMLENAPFCKYASMTGSGSCCFGIFETWEQAKNAETLLRSFSWPWSLVRACKPL